MIRAVVPFLALYLIPFASAGQAAPTFPATVGTAWEYAQTGAEPSRFTIRIAGQELIEGNALLRLETTAEEKLTQVQFIAAEADGVFLHGRRSNDGEVASFVPPRSLLPLPMRVGATWELEDDVAGAPMQQRFKVLNEETVNVPAGEFRAYRLHCEQPWPLSISIDRWFAPGTGFVKEVTTTRGPNGRLLARVNTVLTKVSIAPVAPEPPPSAFIIIGPAPPPEITLEVAPERDGTPATKFQTDAPQLFVHWHGKNLALRSLVRVAWVVEDVGEVAEPNFIIDQTETEVSAREVGTRFVLARPKDGWAAGKYRLELYLDDILLKKVDVSIED